MRRAVRMRVQVPARYVSERLTIEGLVTDLSPDGVFFCSLTHPDVTGETVRISTVPSSLTLTSPGSAKTLVELPPIKNGFSKTMKSGPGPSTIAFGAKETTICYPPE